MEGKKLTSALWEWLVEMEQGREVQSNLHPAGGAVVPWKKGLTSHPGAGALTSGVLLPEDAQWGYVPLQ